MILTHSSGFSRTHALASESHSFLLPPPKNPIFLNLGLILRKLWAFKIWAYFMDFDHSVAKSLSWYVILIIYILAYIDIFDLYRHIMFMKTLKTFCFLLFVFKNCANLTLELAIQPAKCSYAKSHSFSFWKVDRSQCGAQTNNNGIETPMLYQPS